MNLKKNGFTMTELLATIVIIALLLILAVPIYTSITRNAKHSEYLSKKSYLEGLAKRYAEENNLSATTKISVSRLIANGYTTAEKYVMEADSEIPFISNPENTEENLACRVIDLSVDNYEYNANMEEESNCSFAVEETNDAKVGIKAYIFENNKIGELIPYEDGSNTSLKWVNKNVLIVVNPLYEMDEINNIAISIPGSNKMVDKTNMLKESDIDHSREYTNINEYSNVEIVAAEAITKQTISVILELNSTIKSSSAEVKIDKEAPTVDTSSFSGWTSSAKGATVYLSDGSGVGSKGIYVSETNTFNKDNFIGVTDEVAYIKTVNNKELKNQRYYIWTEDKVGNISKSSSYIDISNIDDKKPIIKDTKISSATNGYNSIKINVEISATDENGSGVYQGCITTTNDSNTCSWFAYTPKYAYTIPNATEGSGEVKSIYTFVKDAVGNISDNGKEYKYTIYRKCSQTRTENGTNCTAKCNGGTFNLIGYDKFLEGVRCTSADKPSGGSPCNTFDCCSKTTNPQWSQCSALCNGGTQTRTLYSVYDGRECKKESQDCNTFDCCSNVNYSETTTCSAVCDGGNYYRYAYSKYDGRYCPEKNDWGGKSCNTFSCCSKTTTGAYGECSKACNGGTKTRTVYSAYITGKVCKTESKECNTRKCCDKVTYKDGDKCTATCGGGTKNRLAYSYYDGRRCKSKDVSSGGSACNTQACPSPEPEQSNEPSSCCCNGRYIVTGDCPSCQACDGGNCYGSACS